MKRKSELWYSSLVSGASIAESISTAIATSDVPYYPGTNVALTPKSYFFFMQIIVQGKNLNVVVINCTVYE